jgi:hypothetical protein
VVNKPSDSIPITRAGGRMERAWWRGLISVSSSTGGGRELEGVGGVEWIEGWDRSWVSSLRVMWM